MEIIHVIYKRIAGGECTRKRMCECQLQILFVCFTSRRHIFFLFEYIPVLSIFHAEWNNHFWDRLIPPLECPRCHFPSLFNCTHIKFSRLNSFWPLKTIPNCLFYIQSQFNLKISSTIKQQIHKLFIILSIPWTIHCV